MYRDTRGESIPVSIQEPLANLYVPEYEPSNQGTGEYKEHSAVIQFSSQSVSKASSLP